MTAGFVGFMRIAVLAALGATHALAQTYPTKPIRIVIAQAPGSATDVISRVVGNRLSEELGQPIVIEAKPGAGRMLGITLPGSAPLDWAGVVVSFALLLGSMAWWVSLRYYGGAAPNRGQAGLAEALL